MNQRVREEREVISNYRTMNRIHNDIERSILEDYNMEQGRRKQQYEDSARLIGYALLTLMVGGMISFLVMIMS